MELIFLLFFFFAFSAFSDEPPLNPGSLTVDALFDFSVPVEVIAEGVSQGVGDLSTNLFGEFPDDFEDRMEGIYERNGWANGWEALTEAEWGLSTNDMVRVGDTNGPSFWLDSTFWDGISPEFVNAATAPVSAPSNDVPISSLPVVDFELLSDVWGYLDDDAPPSSTIGQPSQGVVKDALFSDFWVTSLTASALEDFDGGHLATYIRSIPSDSMLYVIKPAYFSTCAEVTTWVSQHANGFRPYVRVVAVFLYWVALYRFLVKRVVFTIQACFEGSSS